MASFSACSDDAAVYITARVGDYTHRLDGVYLSLQVGEDSVGIHVASLAVLERMHDRIGQALTDWRVMHRPAVGSGPDGPVDLNEPLPADAADAPAPFPTECS